MATSEDATGSFVRDGELVVPQPGAVGPWSPEMVGGRHVCGIVAWAIGRDTPELTDFQVARLSVDLFSPVPMAPLRATTTPARAGRRIRVVDVQLGHDGRIVTRATAVLLRRTAHPEGAVWSPALWDMPPPEAITEPSQSTSSWEVRRPGGMVFGAPMTQGRVWMAETEPLVAGEPTTPFERLAMAADFANPLTNMSDRGLTFINTDVTMSAARLPVDEWVGLESTGHVGADGVAIGLGTLYDRQGPLGYASVTALADDRLAARMQASRSER
jgi:hypothetical protein